MATCNGKSLPKGELKPYLLYCLDPKGKTKDPKGQRVLMVYGNFVNNPKSIDDPEGIDAFLTESSLSAGKKFDGNTLRLAFHPKDIPALLKDGNLDKKKLKSIINRVGDKYFQGRPVFGIVHGDTGHIHIHFFSTFLNPNGKPLNFAGRGKYREAIRRQTIMDNICRDHGLSTLSREPGTFRSAKSRVPIGVVRAAEDGAYIWTSDLKKRIASARKSSHDIPSFIQNLEKCGVSGRLRGAGISYDFTDRNGKKRIARGKKLGNYFTLESIQQQIQRANSAEREEQREQKQKQRSQRQAAQAVSQGMRAVEDLSEGRVGRVFISLFGFMAIAMQRHQEKQNRERPVLGGGLALVDNKTDSTGIGGTIGTGTNFGK